MLLKIRPKPSEFGLKTETELDGMMLSRSVLLPWVQFREANYPIPPSGNLTGHAMTTNCTLGARTKELPLTWWNSKSHHRIMTPLQTTATSMYDWPEDNEMARWPGTTHFECLIYKICKRLTGLNEPFEKIFAGSWPRRETKAYDMRLSKVVSVARLAVYLLEIYRSSHNQSETVPIVQRIEELYPFVRPERSPIFSIRRRAALEKSSPKELAAMMSKLASEVSSKKELIDSILELEGIKKAQECCPGPGFSNQTATGDLNIIPLISCPRPPTCSVPNPLDHPNSTSLTTSKPESHCILKRI